MQPICKTSKRLLRINRKLHNQQILVVVEEEEEELPEMRIENKCSNVSIVFQQAGNQRDEEIDVCDPKESQSFAWSNPGGSKTLDIQFFLGGYKFPDEHELSSSDRRDQNRPLSIKTLNGRNQVEAVVGHMAVSF